MSIQTDQERAERQIGLARLLVGVLFLLGLAGLLGALGAVLVILAVLLMIVFHEFGHFATAKLTGMKVTEFFVGFGPRLWSVRKGETEYGVKALPLGGYCKIPGMTLLEEVDPADEARSFRQQRFPKRLLVLVAGSATHFILAFILLFGGLATGAILPIKAEPLPEVGALSDFGTGGETPAQRAGFRVGDRIVAVDGDLITKWEQVRSYTSERAGQEIEFLVERDGRRIPLTATPVDARRVVVDGQPYAPPTGPAIGLVGITPGFESYTPLTAVPAAGKELGVIVGETVTALRGLVTLDGVGRYVDQLQGEETKVGDPRFLSPVGLAQVANTAADNGIGTVLFLLIAINVFVGMFNMVPLLPLDGGHVAIAIYEAIRARPGKRYFADVSKLQPVLIVTLALLAALALTSLWLDIFQPLPLN
ncbi:MAG TPA: M50 family metallopeptidase [Acidimicrobiales bacterium]|nr:M50 family metallopeptidase [Acidimicrobiales bacterium]